MADTLETLEETRRELRIQYDKICDEIYQIEKKRKLT